MMLFILSFLIYSLKNSLPWKINTAYIYYIYLSKTFMSILNSSIIFNLIHSSSPSSEIFILADFKSHLHQWLSDSSWDSDGKLALHLSIHNNFEHMG